MDPQQRLDLKNMIKGYNSEETTEKIRTLKHSKKIRTDILINYQKNCFLSFGLPTFIERGSFFMVENLVAVGAKTLAFFNFSFNLVQSEACRIAEVH